MIRFPVSRPSIGMNEMDMVRRTLLVGQLTQGRLVAQFEENFADYVGVRYAVACSSGTTALHLALESLKIGVGDEVLVPDLTYVAVANAVAYTGAVPVLTDIRPSTWNLDLADADRKVTKRTRAIIITHTYGVCAYMGGVNEFARSNRLRVIEDASEALGAPGGYGTQSDCGTFSFYANKVMTTGEGGMVVTDNAALASRLRLLRGQGQSPVRKFFHPVRGFNYRMTEMQAALGVAQLGRLEELLESRRRVMQGYFSQSPFVSLQDRTSAPWLYTGCVTNSRDEIAERLLTAGIETRPSFVPMHRLPMYQLPDERFPNATSFGSLGLSLPTYPDLRNEEVTEICELAREIQNAVQRPLSTGRLFNSAGSIG